MHQEKLQSFLQSNHESVEGWFFPLDQYVFLELFLMHASMGVQGDVCEIGVYQGKSLILLSILKGEHERLLGFDLFAGEDEELTQANLDKYGVNSDVTLVKGLTSELTTRSLDELVSQPVRFLHVDAGHEYHEVLEQLEMFSPYLTDAGIIAMDDYQDREFPGIEAATLDFALKDRPRRFVPFLASGNKMFLCAPALTAPFQKFLINRQNFRDSCRLTRVRDFDVLILKSKLPVESEAIERQIDRRYFPRRLADHSDGASRASIYSQLEFGSGR
tara:strand:+ start:597 stop:1418 length:822 start_codon:yes stop_codon:yes gene_type:complete